MNTFIQLLLNPAIVSLCAGVLLGTISPIFFPALFVDALSLYLIFTIGFKGGMCFGVANQCTPPLIVLAIISCCIGFIQPFIYYPLLGKITLLTRINAAAVATSYGSISIVTFITAINFLNEQGIAYDSFMSAIAGMMEIPALFSGLFIINTLKTSTHQTFVKTMSTITLTILQSPKIMIIFVGFVVGIVLRAHPAGAIAQSVVMPFQLVLVLFMLDIGMKIAQQRSYIKHLKPSLILFALYMPLINGLFAILIAHKMVIHLGSLVLFAVLLASASYIAVPALIRTQTKEAQEVIYLPLALGITLPFNILIGLPIFYYIAKLMH